MIFSLEEWAMMTERTLRVLEFPRIREMLAEGALTALGAEKCRALTPLIRCMTWSLGSGRRRRRP